VESVDEAVGQLADRSEAGPLADAIQALFERGAAEVGVQARARAVTRHSWSRVFERLSGLYADLTGDSAFVIADQAATTH
jgi:alpha-1,6-mannosyltransferase